MGGSETRARAPPLPTGPQAGGVLRATGRELVDEFGSRGRAVRMIGVRVAHLQKPKGTQSSLPE